MCAQFHQTEDLVVSASLDPGQLFKLLPAKEKGIQSTNIQGNWKK
jgi:hypothetical protein